MGTSVSQSSPATSNWQATQTTYSSPAIPVERTVQEIWRAADSQVEENLATDLKAPIIAECLRITLASSSRMEAVRNVARAVAFSGQSSLASVIAERAAARSFSTVGGSVSSFAKAVFSEASDYLASRDLPGLVGGSEKLLKVSDMTALKASIRERIADVVDDIEVPGEVEVDEGWSNYAEQIVRTLKGAA